MTNEEAIELLNQEKIPMILDGKPNEHLAVAHIKAIEALEENTKLKDEIEELIEQNKWLEEQVVTLSRSLADCYRRDFDRFVEYREAVERLQKENRILKDEVIEQLKIKNKYSILSRKE